MKTYVLDRLERVFYVVGIPGDADSVALHHALTEKSSKPIHIGQSNVMYVEKIGGANSYNIDMRKVVRARAEKRALEVERDYTDEDMRIEPKKRRKRG